MLGSPGPGQQSAIMGDPQTVIIALDASEQAENAVKCEFLEMCFRLSTGDQHWQQPVPWFFVLDQLTAGPVMTECYSVKIQCVSSSKVLLIFLYVTLDHINLF